MITFLAKTANNVIVNSTYSTITFPAGEAHIKIDPKIGVRATEIALVQFSPDSLNTDMFLLDQWVQANRDFDTLYGTEPSLTVVMPYLPGARADKGLPQGAVSYAEFVGNLDIDQFICLDPHSPLWLNYFSGVSTAQITVFQPSDILDYVDVLSEYDGIIAPDKGAFDRAEGVAKQAGLPLFTASKKRDFETGKLFEFNIPENMPVGNYLIVDDICDGGGTFVGLAEAIYEALPEVELDLYVSHGVFSGQAFEKLSDAFTTVYTTNSYNPLRELPMNFGVFDITTQMLKECVV